MFSYDILAATVDLYDILKYTATGYALIIVLRFTLSWLRRRSR